MNQMRRHTRNYDYFRPWQTYRNKSCSPKRKPAQTNMHRVGFADNSKQQSALAKTNDSLHSVFVNHIRQHLPKTAEPHESFQTITIHKRGKDNKNIRIKQNNHQKCMKNEIEYPKLRKQNVYFEDSFASQKFYSSTETNLSSNLNSTPCRIQSVRNVIEKFNRLSAAKTNIPSKQSIKEKEAILNREKSKYNRNLSEFEEPTDLERSFKSKYMDYVPENVNYDKNMNNSVKRTSKQSLVERKTDYILKRDKNKTKIDDFEETIISKHTFDETNIGCTHQNEYNTKNDDNFAKRTSKQIIMKREIHKIHKDVKFNGNNEDLLTKQLIGEKRNEHVHQNRKHDNSDSPKKESKQFRATNKDYHPDHQNYDENIEDCTEEILKQEDEPFVTHKKWCEKQKSKTSRKQNGARLRSQTFQKERKETSRIICDDLLQIFTPKNENESEKKASNAEMDACGKELVSAQTQTTPCCSATNIMINVYDQKSPRSVKHGYKEGSPMEIKISEDDDMNTKVRISREKEIEKKEFEVTKRSVKACIKQFEEHLKKKGMDFRNDTSDVKIFSKIRSNYLLKQEYEPTLSPKAKSVPF